MKKTIRINIKGFIFQVDEDAYQLLHGYLNKLKRHFTDGPEGEEIVSDLELRIAELLQQKLVYKKEVITIDDAKDVISVLGDPEDFDATTVTGEEEETIPKTGSGRRKSHRLYRDPDNAIMGGVSAGLGSYFNTDPIIFRVLFVVLSLGYGIVALIYIILWIVLPAARTTAQKLEMRGEPVTIDNIERAVKSEYDNVRKNFKNYSNSETGDRVRDFLGKVVHVLGILVMALAKILVFVVGIALILGGFAMAISAAGFFFFQKPIISNIFDDAYFNVQGLIDTFVPSSDPTLLLLTVGLVLGIPILAIMYAGIKILFRFKSNDKLVGLGAFVLWFLAVLYVSSIAMIEGRSYSMGVDEDIENELNISAGDTLFIDIGPQSLSDIKKDHLYIEMDEFGIYFGGQEDRIYGKTIIDVGRTHGNKARLIIQKEARGIDSRDANSKLNALSFDYQISGNRLIIPPCYIIEDENEWRAQNVEIDLDVPENTIVIFSRETEGHLDYIYGNELERWQLPGKTVKATVNGLVRTE